ncbi:Phosphoesterase [Dillenia turbinata]|uniref:Phosphoesterase n=1 Tax=Dillenia turbinata TaxID=194707 RepID=A0AAN8VBK0_9MAGN
MVSPWIKKGTVINGPTGPTPNSEYEHSSIPATIKKMFNLSANFLTHRDAWAGTFEQIDLQVISQGRLVDVLMVIRFANKVNHSLNHQTEKEEQEKQQKTYDCIDNSASHVSNTNHNQNIKSKLDQQKAQIQKHKYGNRNTHFTLYQVLALSHGLKAISVFQH